MALNKYWRICALTLLISGVSLPAHSTYLTYIERGVVDPNETWVLVNSDEKTLKVLKGNSLVRVIDGISVGASGSSKNRIKGSMVTPKGIFKVDAINKNSRFHTFFRLNYPTQSHAKEAYIKGTFDYEDYLGYQEHLIRHGSPPQNTALGGQIGIHGLGGRDEYMHKRVNWTEGCVAVTDPEIRELGRYLSVGTQVIIH